MAARRDKVAKRSRERAVALSYSSMDQLPTIVANGAGELARQILALANKYHIPVQQDHALTEMLSKLDIGAAISPETFRAVAEVVSFLYHVDQEWQASHPFLERTMRS
ncbi:MAG: EscU/YscU/HrcU family type III secretion system export apparatus switch protein [Oligoflexia bacterium]|nr:EscU/YscU/HrcU family type III secretion system export apparatus switch protein [Oligoflexia bacterium]